MPQGTHGHSVPTSTTPFQRTSAYRASNLPSFEDFCAKLLKKHYGFVNDDGILNVPISPDYLTSAKLVVRTVQTNSSFKDKIVFNDGGQLRVYNDVVWDLNEQATDFARVLFKEQQQGFQNPLRIFVTTPAIGADGGNTICAHVEAKDKNSKKFSIALQLAGVPGFQFGESYIAQTQQYELRGAGGEFDENRKLDLILRANVATARVWQKPPVQIVSGHDLSL